MEAPAAAALGGIAGSLAFLMVVYMGLFTGMTRMNFLHMLGTMFAPKATRETAYGIGTAVHLMMGAVFGLVHGAIIDALNVASTGAALGWGVALGAIHGAGILMLMPMALTAMHPLARTGDLDQPRFALTGFGSGTPLGSLMAHVVFGVVVAAVYALVGLKV